MKRRDALKLALAAPAIAALPTRGEPAPVLRVQRLSWAGVKLVCGGSTLFIDASYDPSSANTPTPDVALTVDTRDRNALITHHHGDHFDAAALRTALGDSGILVVPESVAPWADTRQFRVQPAKLFEPVFLPRGSAAFVAISVPAVDGLGHPQVSWVVSAGGKRLFHAGDTLWHGHWWDIARAYGPFDLALLPINGFRQVQGRYTDTGIPMDLTPEQAAAAAQVLDARLTVPIHYGGANESYFEEPDATGRFLAAAKTKGVNARLVAPGSWIEI
ncbi:MAG TPA: MBL fold metallo-hydrolase [Usitatibacter sp.]|jgi:L-ascorbate metabolism protein UlaG (beta-lactamase superfamily)|nr:MBL fold metallo-hydrolase [Usitatibacter sp.]